MKHRASTILPICLLSLSFNAFTQEGGHGREANIKQNLEKIETERDASSNDVQVVDASPAKAFLNQFLNDNPAPRQYSYDTVFTNKDSAGEPALQLKRIWVGNSGALVEVLGLPRTGKKTSAVIRRDTLAIESIKGGSYDLKTFAGAQELRDPRGGSAIVVYPGDTAYLLFAPINDYYPFKIRHVIDSGNVYDYFGILDPRFRERYDNAFREAVTPEKMKDFIVEFAKNDPDNRVRGVFVNLIGLMRAQNTFEGYYHTYLLLQDPNDLRMASKLARNNDHKAKIEHMAVATLVDKSRLIKFSLNPVQAATYNDEASCFMFCKYNFSALRPIKGNLTVKLSDKPVIKLAHGSYRVTFSASAFVPRIEQRRSAWLGDRDGESNLSWTKDVMLELRPPDYQGSVAYDLGNAKLTFFQRGSMGGYEAHWPTGDPEVKFTFKSMELIP